MSITPAALQTALGVTIGDPLVMRADETAGADATKQEWQAAAVLAALRA